MSEDEAKAKLAEITGHYTPGTILHFLADLLAAEGTELGDSDPVHAERLKTGEAALFVFGAGLEAALAR